MSYQALARKWRPRHFRDVVGQEHVVKALRTALDQDRIHHAFLFTGTRGVGKTTLGRLFAKALNCEKGVSADPCDECINCQSVTEGRFIDLIEIDAASRTRVDDTREILDNVQYAPTHGPYKVYLIDEVHMLSNHSFNALLKTLEEPPSHVKFLLATTDPHKLPATILSRCLQFNLKAIDMEKIASNLKSILKSEAVVYEDSGLLTLARAASGSMRDGLSLLDQAIAFGDGMVSSDHVREMLGMMEHGHIEQILDALSNEDAIVLIQLIREMEEKSIDYVVALDEMLLLLHDISLYHVSNEALEAKGTDVEKIRELSHRISSEDAQLFYQIGLYGKRDLAFAPNPASGFEMTVLRMMAFRPIQNEDIVSNGSESPIPATRSEATKQLDTKQLDTERLTEKSDIDQYEGLPNPDVWAKLIHDSDLEGISRELAMNLAPIEYKKSVLTVIIDVLVTDLFNKDRQLVIERAVSKLNGRPIMLKFHKSATKVLDKETPAVNRLRHMEETKTQAYKKLITDPTVQDVIKKFDATLVAESVKPGNQ